LTLVDARQDPHLGFGPTTIEKQAHLTSEVSTRRR
jgi:hypothetical protein